MTVRLDPYLNFLDSAREAMTFYQSVLGGELAISTFADFQVSDDPAERSAATTRISCAAGERG